LWSESFTFSTEIVFDAWASSGCLCIALDALRIVCDALCIVFDVWASFDAYASCVEPGAPWVTEALSFAVIFHFFPCLWLYIYRTQVDVSGSRWLYLHFSHDGSLDDVVAIWTLC